jgi:hypothetical protein
MYVYGSKRGTSTLAIDGCRFMRLMITRILYYVFCGKLQRAIVRAGVNIWRAAMKIQRVRDELGYESSLYILYYITDIIITISYCNRFSTRSWYNIKYITNYNISAGERVISAKRIDTRFQTWLASIAWLAHFARCWEINLGQNVQWQNTFLKLFDGKSNNYILL